MKLCRPKTILLAPAKVATSYILMKDDWKFFMLLHMQQTGICTIVARNSDGKIDLDDVT